MDIITNFDMGLWLNRPKEFWIDSGFVRIITEPETDFWQNTYYGFCHANAPAYVFPADEDFTFTVKAEFYYHGLFDQCGVLLYVDEQNWAKASIEMETEDKQWLGSVVTSYGYSDWSTVSVCAENDFIYYRLSKRGTDFLFEQSADGVSFDQMRIFHMHKLPQITMAGVYACSPSQSSFTAEFKEFIWEDCKWV